MVESLDRVYGLDEEARRTALLWSLEPGTGTLNGEAVPVALNVTLEFRLR